MNTSELIPNEADKPVAPKREREDMVQILAEDEYAKSIPSGETVPLGPPSPEDYDEAEKALTEMIDLVASDKKWVILNRALLVPMGALLGFAPMTLKAVIAALLKSNQPEWITGQKEHFLENLRKEMKTSYVEPLKFAASNPAAERLDEVKKRADVLADLHGGQSTDSQE